MSKLRVNCFALSFDGYGAGPNQSLDNPLGEGGEGLHGWFLPTRTFRKMFGKEDGETGPDDDFAMRGMDNIGAWILGRNMFAASRGPWPDDGWQGWWGDTPPYHTDVFVLTHHARAPLKMAGGTTFHFVTDGIHAALDRAMASANGKDVRLGGGVATLREYLTAKLVDEMHLAVSPVLLGAGEHLLQGIDLPALGFTMREFVTTPKAAHYVLTKQR
jgi:dihydrofolate reductase